jgi:hypothetical protein
MDNKNKFSKNKKTNNKQESKENTKLQLDKFKNVIINNSNNTSNNSNNTSNKLNKTQPIFIYIIFIVGVVLLIIVFLYYEFYYLPSNKKNEHFITILDYRNNKNKPYLFEQKFGTNKSGNVVYDDGNKIETFDKYIEYNTIDEFDCNTTLSNVTISMDFKLPYVSPNQDWNSTFKKNKNIIQFGSSPIISYNPFKNKIIFSILYKDNPNRQITETIEIDGLTTTWINLIFVIQNRNITIYLNKTLIKNITLKTVPILNFNNKTLVKIGDYNNNFNGLVNNITLYEKSSTLKEIQKL